MNAISRCMKKEIFIEEECMVLIVEWKVSSSSKDIFLN